MRRCAAVELTSSSESTIPLAMLGPPVNDRGYSRRLRIFVFSINSAPAKTG